MKTSLSLISSQVNQDDYIQTIINELYQENWSMYTSSIFYFLILLIVILDYLDEIRGMVVSHSEK